jgi:hypothetical protein
MLRVEPKSYTRVREWLTLLGVPAPPYLPSNGEELPVDHPVLHVPYRDVSATTVANVFSYAGLGDADAPLGLASVQDATWWPGPDAVPRVRVFPLAGFIGHLQACASGSSDDDEQSAFAIAIAGVVSYCQANECALTVRW